MTECKHFCEFSEFLQSEVRLTDSCHTHHTTLIRLRQQLLCHICHSKFKLFFVFFSLMNEMLKKANMFHSSAARVIISAKREKQWGHKFFYTNKSAQTPFCFLLSCSCDSVGFLWRLKTNESITSVSPVRRNMKLHRVFSVQTAILSPLLTSFSLTFCCFCWSERESDG